MPAAAQARTSKAGRNLPAAIAVGAGLGALALVCLFSAAWGWLLRATPACFNGGASIRRGFVAGGHAVPVLPVVIGAAAMLPAAYAAGPSGLTVVFGLTVLAVVVWRFCDGPRADTARDIGSGVFMVAYAPFLASFSALLLAQPDGQLRVVCFVLITVFSDIGGYAAGVLFGKHPMAPTVSPKKSWEGFAGSVISCAVAGAASVTLLLGGPWWAGVITGAVLASLATLGDLTESMLKRDLGIKDFGTMLPGHGGLMDRMDSLLVCAPAAWILFTVLLGG